MRLSTTALVSFAAVAVSVGANPVLDSAEVQPFGHQYSRRDLLTPLDNHKSKSAHKKHKRGSCAVRKQKQKVLASNGDGDHQQQAENHDEWKQEEHKSAEVAEHKEEKQEEWSAPSATSSFSEQWSEPTPNPKAEEKKKSKSTKNNNGGGAKWDERCGSSGASDETSKLSGPNGSMDWFNCGLTADGWTPPSLNIADVRAIPLDEALEDSNSPFKACDAYKHIFDRYGHELGIPPIMLASIAMQESTCNKDARGGGGEVGLMQITSEKCTAGINCADPDYNIGTGARYFKKRLDDAGGNVLLALGGYNGWSKGLTIGKITSVRGSCCKCQQNVNYFQQMLNGWCQNKPGYDLGDWDMGC